MCFLDETSSMWNTMFVENIRGGTKHAVLFLDNNIVIVIAFSDYYFIKQMVL